MMRKLFLPWQWLLTFLDDKTTASISTRGNPILHLLHFLFWSLCTVATAGCIRYVLKSSFEQALVISGLINGLAFVLLLPFIPRWTLNRVQTTAVAAILLLVFGTTFSILYNPLFNGLPTVGGGDAGNHIALQRAFVQQTMDMHPGFVGFFGFSHLLEIWTGADAFRVYRTGFYLSVFCTLLAPLVVLVAYLLKKSESAPTSSILAAGAAMFAALLFHIVPVLHYSQADGFYYQLFALIPFCAAWVSYSVITHRLLRLGLMSYFIVWLRYTYGLNLADLLITAGVMTLFEAVAAKRVLVRTGMLLFGVSLLAAGAYSHVLLKKIISIPGAYVPSHFGYTTAALILAGISFLSLSRKAQLGQSAEGVVDRALRFAGIFALVGVLTRFIYLRLGFPLDYYLQKYVMYPGALAALALPLAFLRLHSRLTTSRLTQNAHAEFVTWLKQGASNPAIRNYGLLFGIVLVGPISFFAVLGIIQSNLLHSTTVFLVSGAWLAYLTWLWKDSKTHRNLSQLLLAVALPTVALSLFSAAEPYFESCTNRISRTPPFTKIGPLIDRDTLLLIQEKTTKHNSKFGGIIVPSWPMSNFMNAMLDYYGDYALYKKGTINRQQNSCVFWYANKEDFETYEKISPEVTTQVAQLESDPQKECQEHRRKWEPRDRAIQRVCFRCY